MIKVPPKQNCLTFAFGKWRKHPKTTYLVIRQSKHAWFWPHIFFTRDIECLNVEEFSPDNPKTGWRAFFHAWRYKGHIRKGKGEEK